MHFLSILFLTALMDDSSLLHSMQLQCEAIRLEQFEKGPLDKFQAKKTFLHRHEYGQVEVFRIKMISLFHKL